MRIAYILLIVATGICCMPPPKGISAAKSEQSREVFFIETGEYLRSDYIESIKKTLSPFESGRINQLLGATVLADKCKVTIIMMTNFHEGSPLYYLHADGKISSAHLSGTKEPMSIQIQTKDTILIQYSSLESYLFINVDNIDSFIGKLIFSGRYVDQNGALYEFTAAGTVMLNGDKYNYSVFSDHIEFPYDVLRLTQGPEQRLFKFTSNANTITLYEINDDDNIIAIHPFMVLRKTD